MLKIGVRFVNESLALNVTYLPLPKKNKPQTSSKVQSIKNKEDIVSFRQSLLKSEQRYTGLSLNLRNYAIFVLGTNCARRAGDILKLRIKDVLTSNGEIKDMITIVEQKTSKVITIPFNSDVKQALGRYINSKEILRPNDYIFQSRKGENSPIKVSTFWDIMKKTSEKIGLDSKGVNVGTHSMRKTAGYFMYQNTHDIVAIQKAFNHSNTRITERYIGVEQDEINAVIRSIDYGIED